MTGYHFSAHRLGKKSKVLKTVSVEKHTEQKELHSADGTVQ